MGVLYDDHVRDDAWRIELPWQLRALGEFTFPYSDQHSVCCACACDADYHDEYAGKFFQSTSMHKLRPCIS